MKKRVINIILLIIWLGVIFFFSAQKSEESSKTSGIFDRVIKVFIKNEEHISTAKFVVRKVAHFTEYFILALLIINVIKDYKEINYKLLLLTLILCFLYACSDEWHQTFVEGRAGQFKDVLIDTSGALAGILMYKLFKRIKIKKS